MTCMPTMILHTVVILIRLSLIRLPALPSADIALVHSLFSPSRPRPVHTCSSGCVRLWRPFLKWMRVSDMSSTLTGGVDDLRCRALPLLWHMILRSDPCCLCCHHTFLVCFLLPRLTHDGSRGTSVETSENLSGEKLVGGRRDGLPVLRDAHSLRVCVCWVVRLRVGVGV